MAAAPSSIPSQPGALHWAAEYGRNRLRQGSMNEALMAKQQWQQRRKEAVVAPKPLAGDDHQADDPDEQATDPDARAGPRGAAAAAAAVPEAPQLACTRSLRSALMAASGGGPFSLRSAMAGLLAACAGHDGRSGGSSNAGSDPSRMRIYYSSYTSGVVCATVDVPLLLREQSNVAKCVSHEGERLTLAAFVRLFHPNASWKKQVYVGRPTGGHCNGRLKLSEYVERLTPEEVRQLKRRKAGGQGGGRELPGGGAEAGDRAGGEGGGARSSGADVLHFLLGMPTCLSHPRSALQQLLEDTTGLARRPSGPPRPPPALPLRSSVLLDLPLPFPVARPAATGVPAAAGSGPLGHGQPSTSMEVEEAGTPAPGADGKSAQRGRSAALQWTPTDVTLDVPPTGGAALLARMSLEGPEASAAGTDATLEGGVGGGQGLKRKQPGGGGGASGPAGKKKKGGQVDPAAKAEREALAAARAGMPLADGSAPAAQALKTRSLRDIYGPGVLGVSK